MNNKQQKDDAHEKIHRDGITAQLMRYELI